VANSEAILIIEPDEARRGFLLKVLQDAGLASRAVDSGLTGVQQIAAAEPDVVILSADITENAAARPIAEIK